ncbi:hypothetical protein JD844_001649 [Phrynosoma platyrhinos]|uniref:Kringle-containing protein marking the eye and the nose n=1 Tax=Phrynosoma platyrhinos TaxID=52577 RepID=A0ABQ7TAU4_PHRPL|nr:hypothetical protein JD844_001649 [Phrynosoma platyrhinos]
MLLSDRAELSECFMVNGADYRGSQNRTSLGSTGRACLYWNQTREHAYNTAKYPNVPGYVGCFLDSGTPPALSGSSGTSTKLTVQVCLSFCRKRGYKFAGVEAGYACFCGHEGDVRRSQPVSAVECDQVCFGKSSELCGGDGRIGIYNVSLGACQGNFSEPSGVIYSPQFPDDYEADSNCSWALHPVGCDSVELTFRIFDVHDPNDRLELRDGHSNVLLAQFDGRWRPGTPLLFPTNYLLLSFQSDQLLQAQGFAILYRGMKGSSVNLRTLPGDGSRLAPTSSDWLNSTWTYSASDPAIGVGAWVMYTATGTFILAIILISYHLRKSYKASIDLEEGEQRVLVDSVAHFQQDNDFFGERNEEKFGIVSSTVRTCLFVQKKTGSSLVPFSSKGPRSRCQCLGGEAWAVAYRHTRVVICTTRGAPHHRPLHNSGGVAGDDEASSDCSCLCHSYENLSSTNQSSLKSLISTI